MEELYMKMMMCDSDKKRVVDFLKERGVKTKKELANLNWNFISATKLLPDDW